MKLLFKSTDKKANLLKIISAGGFLLFALILNLQVRAQQAYHFQWAHSAGGHEVGLIPSNPVTDESGNIYITCDIIYHTADSVVFDNGTTWSPYVQSVLAKYTPEGQLLWLRSLEGNNKTKKIASDKNGHIYVWGNMYGLLTLDTITLISNTSVGFLAKFDTAGNAIWAEKLIDTNEMRVNYSAMTVNQQGAIYLSGAFFSPTLTLGTNTFHNSDLTGGTGSNAGLFSGDYFICKYDTNGSIIWATSGGDGAYQEAALGLTTDNQGALYASIGSQNAWIVYPDSGKNYLIKYDQTGNVQWEDTLLNVALANNMFVDNNYNLFIGGMYNHFADLGNGITLGDVSTFNGGGFVAKFSPTGETIWGKEIRSNPSDVATFINGISVDKAGNASISGTFVNSITDTFSQLIFGTDTISMHINGFSWDTRDIFLARYDAQGNVIEAKVIGGFYTDQNSGLAGAEDGSLYLSGSYFSPVVDFDSIALTNTAIVNPDTLYYARLYLAKYTSGDNDTTTNINAITIRNYVRIFPNPTTGQLSIQSSIDMKDIRLYDIQGKSIFHKAFLQPEINWKLYLQNQPDGIYWLRIQDKTGGLVVKKIVLRK